MNLREIVNRAPPRPWLDGEKIPWDEPQFSARMLQEHLSQAHDAASRRSALVDAHVAWIHAHVLGGRPAHILDLGCGPGLYLNRLTRHGHVGTGLDFSPASLAYARETAAAGSLPAVYRSADLRTAEFLAPGETPYDLAMLLYGEFNTFRTEVAAAILRKAYGALRPGGKLLLEPSTFAAIEVLGRPGPSWYAAQSGLWSAEPHLVLQDNAWDAAACTAVERYTIVDAATGAVTQYAMTTRAFDAEELAAHLQQVGFVEIALYPSLLGRADHPFAQDHAGFYAVLAQKPD